MSSQGDESSSDSSSKMNEFLEVLPMLFFIVAAIWMTMASIYATSVCVYLRMRSTGYLYHYESSHPEYGRVYLWGSPLEEGEETSSNLRLYIPFGPLFRHFNTQSASTRQERSRAKAANVMTSKERHMAMYEILSLGVEKSQANHTTHTSNDPQTSLAASDANGICAICLSGYGDDTDVESIQSTSEDKTKYCSTTCSHSFHMECLLEWLARPLSVECPCCRVPMVQEEAVIKVVRQQRKRRKLLKTQSSARKSNPLTTVVCNDSNTSQLPFAQLGAEGCVEILDVDEHAPQTPTQEVAGMEQPSNPDPPCDDQASYYGDNENVEV